MDLTESTLSPADLREQLEAFLPTLAPADFKTGIPFYVIEESEIGLDEGAELLGCSSKHLDLLLAKSSRWRGRGPAVALNLRTMRGVYRNDLDFYTISVCLAIHEFAHALTHGVDREEISGTRAASINTILRRVIREHVQPLEDPSTPTTEEISHHNADFVRLCGHLHHRACNLRSGVFALPWLAHLIVNPPAYGLAHTADEYFSALGDEPRAMVAVPFQKILKTTPPAAFKAMYSADVAARGERIGVTANV